MIVLTIKLGIGSNARLTQMTSQNEQSQQLLTETEPEAEPSQRIDRRVFRWVMRRIRIGYLPIALGLITSVVAYLYLMDVVDPRGNYNSFADFSRLFPKE